MQFEESQFGPRGEWKIYRSLRTSTLRQNCVLIGMAMALTVMPPFVKGAYADCASDREAAYANCQTVYEGKWNAAAAKYTNVDMLICFNNGVTTANIAAAAFAAASVACGISCLIATVGYPICLAACIAVAAAVMDGVLAGAIITRLNCENTAAITRNGSQQDALDERNNVCYVMAETNYANCMGGGDSGE